VRSSRPAGPSSSCSWSVLSGRVALLPRSRWLTGARPADGASWPTSGPRRSKACPSASRELLVCWARRSRWLTRPGPEDGADDVARRGDAVPMTSARSLNVASAADLLPAMTSGQLAGYEKRSSFLSFPLRAGACRREVGAADGEALCARAVLPNGLTASAMFGPRSAATCGTWPNAASQPTLTSVPSLQAWRWPAGAGRGPHREHGGNGDGPWSTGRLARPVSGREAPVCQVLLGLVGDVVDLEEPLPPGSSATLTRP